MYIFYIYVYFFSERAMAPHSSTLAWKIPWMEEPGGLQSIGSLRVGHDWETSLNPMDGGAWWAAVRGVAKSPTRLRDFTFTFHFHALEKETATHSSVLAWENPRDGGAWWAAVYGVTQSRTRLKRLSSSSSSIPFLDTYVHTFYIWVYLSFTHVERKN